MERHSGHTTQLTVLPTRLCLLVMAAALALALTAAVNMTGEQHAVQGAQHHEPELTHGDRFMPRVLIERAQRFYTAAARWDHETVWRMTHPSERRKCTPVGTLDAVAADNPAPRVQAAIDWHGSRVGATGTAHT